MTLNSFYYLVNGGIKVDWGVLCSPLNSFQCLVFYYQKWINSENGSAHDVKRHKVNPK